jgi:hypothetical protein
VLSYIQKGLNIKDKQVNPQNYEEYLNLNLYAILVYKMKLKEVIKPFVSHIQIETDDEIIPQTATEVLSVIWYARSSNNELLALNSQFISQMVQYHIVKLREFLQDPNKQWKGIYKELKYLESLKTLSNGVASNNVIYGHMKETSLMLLNLNEVPQNIKLEALRILFNSNKSPERRAFKQFLKAYFIDNTQNPYSKACLITSILMVNEIVPKTFDTTILESSLYAVLDILISRYPTIILEVQNVNKTYLNKLSYLSNSSSQSNIENSRQQTSNNMSITLSNCLPPSSTALRPEVSNTNAVKLNIQKL